MNDIYLCCSCGLDWLIAQDDLTGVTYENGDEIPEGTICERCGKALPEDEIDELRFEVEFWKAKAAQECARADHAESVAGTWQRSYYAATKASTRRVANEAIALSHSLMNDRDEARDIANALSRRMTPVDWDTFVETLIG